MSALKDYSPRFGPGYSSAAPGAPAPVTNNVQYMVSVTLTATQIAAMFATPIALIAAPGSGKALVPEQFVVEINRTSTAFTSGGVVHFYYHGQTTELMSQTIAAASITGATGQEIDLLGPAATAGGTVVLANTGIDITNATGAFAAGTGATVKVFMRYRVITL